MLSPATAVRPHLAKFSRPRPSFFTSPSSPGSPSLSAPRLPSRPVMLRSALRSCSSSLPSITARRTFNRSAIMSVPIPNDFVRLCPPSRPHLAPSSSSSVSRADPLRPVRHSSPPRISLSSTAEQGPLCPARPGRPGDPGARRPRGEPAPPSPPPPPSQKLGAARRRDRALWEDGQAAGWMHRVSSSY